MTEAQFYSKELGQWLSSSDYYSISAAPSKEQFGTAVGHHVPGALTNAPAGTYDSSIQAQIAGLQMQFGEELAKKQGKTLQQVFAEDQAALANNTETQVSFRGISPLMLAAGALFLLGVLKK